MSASPSAGSLLALRGGGDPPSFLADIQNWRFNRKSCISFGGNQNLGFIGIFFEKGLGFWEISVSPFPKTAPVPPSNNTPPIIQAAKIDPQGGSGKRMREQPPGDDFPLNIATLPARHFQ